MRMRLLPVGFARVVSGPRKPRLSVVTTVLYSKVRNGTLVLGRFRQPSAGSWTYRFCPVESLGASPVCEAAARRARHSARASASSTEASSSAAVRARLLTRDAASAGDRRPALAPPGGLDAGS